MSNTIKLLLYNVVKMEKWKMVVSDLMRMKMLKGLNA